MHLRQLEGVSFVNRRYKKRVPFLLKMACKRIMRGGKVGGPSSYNTAACYCHILCFLLFLVFN